MTIGRYIVAGPAICHGEPVFRGTRILVADVLEQVASGMAWEAIVDEWRGALTKEAIVEAVRIAREMKIAHAPELMAETVKPRTFWTRPFQIASGSYCVVGESRFLKSAIK